MENESLKNKKLKCILGLKFEQNEFTQCSEQALDLIIAQVKKEFIMVFKAATEFAKIDNRNFLNVHDANKAVYKMTLQAVAKNNAIHHESVQALSKEVNQLNISSFPYNTNGLPIPKSD